MVVFSLKIDEGLRQRRERFPENFIKGIPVIGIDPALKIEEREEQIVDAFLNTHGYYSIWLRNFRTFSTSISSPERLLPHR